MKNLRWTLVVITLLFSPLLFLNGCGTTSSGGTSYSYTATGSLWSFSINSSASTWSGTESVSGVSVSGTYTTASTGFMKLTVTSASGTGAPSVGASAWAVQIPGVAFFVNPILSSESNILLGLSAGTCPTATSTSYNYIQGQHGLER